MAKILTSPESQVGGTGSKIQEYAAKVAQALEMETNKLREQAAQDSHQIISRSKLEADKIITQAKEEARAESDKLIASLKAQAEQILNESREKSAVAARRESDKVLNETWDRIAQTITNAIENDIEKAKNDFIRVASEAKSKLENEKSRLMAVTQNIETIIRENETSIQAGIEHLTVVINETGDKMRSIKRVPDTDTLKTPRPAAEAPVKTIYTVKLKKQETDTSSREDPGVKSEISIKPEAAVDPETLMQEGLSLLSAGKNKEALEVFDKVIYLDPKNPIAWRKKGASLDKLGRHDESLKAYGKAIELAPNYISECLSSELAIARKAEQTEAQEVKAEKKEPQKQKEETASSKLNRLSKLVTTKLF